MTDSAKEKSMQRQSQPQQQAAAGAPVFDPGHVMTRLHYERLARQAAAERQK